MPLAGELNKVGSRIFKGEAQRRRAGRTGHFPHDFFNMRKIVLRKKRKRKKVNVHKYVLKKVYVTLILTLKSNPKVHSVHNS